ncbi:short-chain dehydrogenase reductase [Fusarium albosuccineum]|uniref:Short-chain dehydrogenase reductase n=1 Tax=Fusarium albosuccineum TaxID=1237068 RepID=A0A8H4L0C4_9HYPO|nr:short-chain dehydrogenase reductase [Fusarium albosuccineum]
MSSQQTALVTGTSKGGIGDYLAQDLHKRGFRVFATARSPAKVQHLKEMGLHIVLLEVTDSESIGKAAEEVNGLTGGRLDILINNSGVGYMAPLLDADMATAKALFDVNVWGVLEVTNAFSPMLIASKGTIINIGSVVSRIPIPFQGIYNVSKAALEHLSRQMRVEFTPLDVKVIHVSVLIRKMPLTRANQAQVVTGGIKTPFFAHAGVTELTEASPYYPGREELGGWISGEAHEALQPTPPEVFAKRVIDNALGFFPTTCQYAGYGSLITWFCSKVLWNNATDMVLWAMGMPDIKKAIFGNKKQKKIE